MQVYKVRDMVSWYRTIYKLGRLLSEEIITFFIVMWAHTLLFEESSCVYFKKRVCEAGKENMVTILRCVNVCFSITENFFP